MEKIIYQHRSSACKRNTRRVLSSRDKWTSGMRVVFIQRSCFLPNWRNDRYFKDRLQAFQIYHSETSTGPGTGVLVHPAAARHGSNGTILQMPTRIRMHGVQIVMFAPTEANRYHPYISYTCPWSLSLMYLSFLQHQSAPYSTCRVDYPKSVK